MDEKPLLTVYAALSLDTGNVVIGIEDLALAMYCHSEIGPDAWLEKLREEFETIESLGLCGK